MIADGVSTYFSTFQEGSTGIGWYYSLDQPQELAIIDHYRRV